jgi:hypothetical protein
MNAAASHRWYKAIPAYCACRSATVDLFRELFNGEIFSLCSFQQAEFFSALKKFIIRQHSVFDENLNVVPFLFKILAVVLNSSSSLSATFLVMCALIFLTFASF